MSFACGIDEARLSVLLDIRHPFAYLALRPAIRLGQEHGIAINWLPLTVPPLRAPSTPTADEDRGIRHRRARAQALQREIETYAAAQGLVVRDYYRDGDASAFERAWLFVREHHPERLERFLVECFRAYFELELDPSRDDEVARKLAEIGADAQAFLEWSGGEGVDVAARMAEALRERGLSGVPCYVIEDEVFLGRQHLPMIRWILEGRTARVRRRAGDLP